MAGEDDLTFGPVEFLCQELANAGVPAAQDPSKLNMPGAWVTVDQIVPSVLAGGWEIQCLIFLIVPDQDYKRASRRLASLFNLLAPAGVQPDGPVRPQGVIMPGDPTPLPALRVPVNLYTTD